MPTQWYEGRIVEIQRLSSRLRSFVLVVEGVDQFDFLPGQFITVDLPISEKRRGRWRSYSIANAPISDNKLELCIVDMEGGSATDYLFHRVDVGSVLKFKGPDGMFVLPDVSDRELVMVCTGTGVAPFRSMIQYIYSTQMEPQKVHLIFGARSQDEILYREEFESLAEEQPTFTYDVCLSREEKNPSWGENIREGYVHQVYLEAYPTAKEERVFLLCGWTAMIDQAVANLIKKTKHLPKQIKYELYG